jgi:HAD superfamily hydrolase (TIGR01509 family)
MKYCVSEFPDAGKLPDNFEAIIPELHQSKTKHYTELLSTGAIPLRPGVERLLHEARNTGLILAIATTTTPANVTALLTHTLGEESLKWFDVIAAGDIVPAKKPAGDIYNYALKAMDLTAEQCLAFEDSHNGILSSLDAKLTTLITVNDYTRGHDFTGAAMVLDNLGEPGKPFNVIQGDANNYTMVDCELLMNLHKIANYHAN